MEDLNSFASLSRFEVSSFSNPEALLRWHQFHTDLVQPGCMVTVLGRQGEALEFRFHSPNLHFQVAADFTLDRLDDAFPNHIPETVLVSGPCYEPGCADFGQKVSCCLVLKPLQ